MSQIMTARRTVTRRATARLITARLITLVTPQLKKGLRLLPAAALIGLCAAGNAHAAVEQFTPVRDNTLYERPTGDVSNGAGTGLFFGQTGVNAGNVLRRAVMAFNISATIPAGSIINDASLTITVDMVPPGATGFDATLHRLTADWGEGTSNAPGTGGSGAPAATNDATWIHRFFNTDLWTNPGGDFVAQASSTATIGAGTGTFTFTATPELLADIQAWVDQPADNFGWIILGEEANAQNARRIASSENATGAPLLTIDFTPGGPNPQPAIAVPALNPAGLVLLLLGTLFLATRRLRRVKG